MQQLYESKKMLIVVAVFLTVLGHSCAQCPEGCSCLRNNKIILCSGASLTEVPAFPDSIKQEATSLNLEGNQIIYIREADLHRFIKLESLDLSHNRISSIEGGSFSTNVDLTKLDLSQNKLRELSDHLFEMTQLLELDLSGNDIGNLSSFTFVGVQPHSIINLANNVIRTFTESTFDAVGEVYQLSLTGNPLDCDCYLRWFPEFRDFNGNLGQNLGACSTPALLSAMSLQGLAEDQFVCECSHACVNGSCNGTVGECECSNGFLGNICDTACPAGTFGEGCVQACTCLSEHESSPCDNVDGTCHCRPGYTGPSCEQECRNGFYGQDCLDMCACDNGECNFITGFCTCSEGYVGVACTTMCPPLRYGSGCSHICTCQTGDCHHITGVCSCPEDYFGSTCSHNCTEAGDCASLGRVECSTQTPEQKCGPCLTGYVGVAGNGTTECISCSGAPDCYFLNRQPCSIIANTCGPCNTRHITLPLGDEGSSNVQCFDPCIDDIMNYNETDVDCGGPLCPSCGAHQACSSEADCGVESVCLGFYEHPSGLDFPYDIKINNSCALIEGPGNAILDRFRNAFRERENPLPGLNPSSFTRAELEASVEQELRTQFSIEANFEVAITQLDQEPGNPLYQTYVEFSEDYSFDGMIQSIHAGRLLGTTIFNYEGKKALYNF